jgi:hypothetical protein
MELQKKNAKMAFNDFVTTYHYQGRFDFVAERDQSSGTDSWTIKMTDKKNPKMLLKAQGPTKADAKEAVCQLFLLRHSSETVESKKGVSPFLEGVSPFLEVESKKGESPFLENPKVLLHEKCQSVGLLPVQFLVSKQGGVYMVKHPAMYPLLLQEANKSGGLLLVKGVNTQEAAASFVLQNFEKYFQKSLIAPTCKSQDALQEFKQLFQDGHVHLKYTSSHLVADAWIQEHLWKAKEVALDCEANQGRSLCTVQICAGNKCLVFHHSLSSQHSKGLDKLLRDAATVKVVVDGQHDIGWLTQAGYSTPKNVLDLAQSVQEAYGLSPKVGLGRLSKIFLSISKNPETTKKYQLESWQKELSQDLQLYAACDAFLTFLLALSPELSPLL